MGSKLAYWEGPLLAIESSCDESAASVLVGNSILSNVVASQVEMHTQWGGVVPEAAARAHVESMLPVVMQALGDAKIERPTAIAVTNRPGLLGSLSIGVSTAKALAMAWQVPLVGVHHIEGHLLSILSEVADPNEVFPFLALVVSGGHTELVWMRGPGQADLLAETVDDAAGEAFDKGARLLGLGYPGGLRVQQMASGGDPKRYPLPVPMRKDMDRFSFSGLKTAMLRLVEKEGSSIDVPDACASLQNAIVTGLIEKTVHAIRTHHATRFALVGGVAANLALRTGLRTQCERMGVEFLVPPIELCTDNAAMIGLAGSLRLALGERDDLSMDVYAQAEL